MIAWDCHRILLITRRATINPISDFKKVYYILCGKRVVRAIKAQCSICLRYAGSCHSWWPPYQLIGWFSSTHLLLREWITLNEYKGHPFQRQRQNFCVFQNKPLIQIWLLNMSKMKSYYFTWFDGKMVQKNMNSTTCLEKLVYIKHILLNNTVIITYT